MIEKWKAIPNAHVLYSYASQRLTWKEALCEWIDNALDVEATSVAIEVSQEHVSIADNGAGCADLRAFVTLGESKRHPGSELGVWGVGSKDAALWIGGVNSSLHVQSVHRGQMRDLRVHWESMAKNEWDPGDQRDPRPAEPGEAGTRITVRAVQGKLPRRIPEGAEWDRLVADIGYCYSPAIKRGAQITLRAKKKGAIAVPAPRWQMPKFDGETVDTIVTVNGKNARVYCGLVADGEQNPRWGLTYSRGFRVILESSQKGCGSYNISRVCGFVEMDKSWRSDMGKNKSEIIRNADDLYAAVEIACRPVLERADRIGMELRSQAFEAQVSETLNNALAAATAKAKRKSPTKAEEGATPTKIGGKHKKAAVEQDGATFPGKTSASAPSTIAPFRG